MPQQVSCSWPWVCGEVTTPRQEERQQAIESLEHDLRDCIHSVLGMKVGDNYWKSNIPLAVREGAQQRIDEALRKHPDIRPSDLASPRSKLDFVNVMDYRTIIENGSNWLFFEAIFRRKQDLANHLESFSEYRNTVMHSRAMTELVRLKGDAAMIWFENVLPAQNQIATTDDSEEEDEEENGDE